MLKVSVKSSISSIINVSVKNANILQIKLKENVFTLLKSITVLFSIQIIKITVLTVLKDIELTRANVKSVKWKNV